MTIWVAWSMIISALFAAAAAATERIAGYSGASRRFAWIGAMLASVVVSVAIPLRPNPTTRPSATTEAPTVIVPATLPNVPVPGNAPAAVDLPARSFYSAATVQRLVAWSDAWIAPGWLIASFAWLALLMRSLLDHRRRRAQWSEASLDGHRVLLSRDDGPAVVGILRPRIVVPQWALDANASTRDLLLRHELEHLRAQDTRVLFVGVLLRLVFPWNGALWWMTRRLRLAIEIDCDARVIRTAGNAYSYGLMLLSVGERYAADLPMSAFLSEHRTLLETRIDVMTTPRSKRPIVASLPFAVLALAVLALAAWTPLPAPVVRQLHSVVARRRDTVASPVLARPIPETMPVKPVVGVGRVTSIPRDVAVIPIVTAAAISPNSTVRPGPVELETASTLASRAFDEWLKAYNGDDSLELAYLERHAAPPQTTQAIMKERRETGGIELISLGEVGEFDLDYTARQKRDGSQFGGYFALRSGDTTRIGWHVVYYVTRDRSLADAVRLARAYHR